MTPRLVVRPATEADVHDATPWYERRPPGLGTEFLCAVDVTLAEVARMPERFPVVYRESRRASPDLVSVVACMHARRDPRRWEDRVTG
jgi:hypothetical protein